METSDANQPPVQAEDAKQDATDPSTKPKKLGKKERKEAELIAQQAKAEEDMIKAATDEVGRLLEKSLTGTQRGEEKHEYNEPLSDPYKQAIFYLEKHNIMQLFQNLTSHIAFNRPPDPLEAMMEQLQVIKKKRAKNASESEEQIVTTSD